MKLASKMSVAAAATLFTTVFFVMTGPAAYADDYCITNGAQTAHGCGYPSMEMCRAASAGIGGICSLAAGSVTNPNNANAMVRSKRHSRAAVTTRNASESR